MIDRLQRGLHVALVGQRNVIEGIDELLKREIAGEASPSACSRGGVTGETHRPGAGRRLIDHKGESGDLTISAPVGDGGGAADHLHTVDIIGLVTDRQDPQTIGHRRAAIVAAGGEAGPFVIQILQRYQIVTHLDL